MDTSPEYINMCRQAKELQEMWEPKEGDWFIPRKDIGQYDIPSIGILGTIHAEYIPLSNEFQHEYGSNVFGFMRRKNIVWLPRIDQLIVLSGLKWNEFLSNGFYVGTFEQSCIQIVMEIKYNKKWNGEDWI